MATRDRAWSSGAVLREVSAVVALAAREVDRHAVRLVVIDGAREPRLVPFATLPALLRAGDLVVLNDAATLPASLRGTTERGEAFELRLSGPIEPHRLAGILMGEGDHRTRTGPSAGRPLTWDVLLGLRAAGVTIATVTHGAGLSATGDDALDHTLPWPERYEIPRRTSLVIAEARTRGGRVIAVGTTVVRALEAAADKHGYVTPGSGVASLRLGPATRPAIVDGVISGLHVPGESHFELLQAFASRDALDRGLALAATSGLSSHELGDACLMLR